MIEFSARARRCALPVPRERRDPNPVGSDARRRNRRTRGDRAHGLRRLWRRADLSDDDDRAYARRQLSPGLGSPHQPAVYTNTAPNGAFRACNGVYNTFALERHTDEICAALGMDPLEFRRRNVLGDGDLGSTGPGLRGRRIAADARPDGGASARKKSASRRPGQAPAYGRATTVGSWFVFVGPSAATVNLNADGTAP